MCGLTNEEAAVLERDDKEFYSDVEFLCDFSVLLVNAQCMG